MAAAAGPGMGVGPERMRLLRRALLGVGVGTAGLSHPPLANAALDFRDEGGVLRPFQV